MAPFGQQLRRLRMRAGLGLRTFAELIAERTSTVSAIELSQRNPWHRADKLARVADVLGLVGGTPFCDDFLTSARSGSTSANGSAVTNGTAQHQTRGTLAWWWTTDNAPVLDQPTVREMAEFIGAAAHVPTVAPDETIPAEELARYPALTELAAEWRVRQLLGRREAPLAAAPVDVEAVLEKQGEGRIEIIPGLVPHFSVQACAVIREGSLTLLVDRIVADSRPLASYRELLARLYAPAALWVSPGTPPEADWFAQLQQHDDWPQLLRDCERFALAMLLPAGPVLAAAEVAYREVVEQQGWVDTDTAARSVRNRLAEQFAVPPLLVHTRLVRWPCHVYGRIAQALAAEELTLPPVDWFEEEPGGTRQGMLFENA
jgi:transcriptional regulator with XRE-family HTH domain